MLAKDYKMAPLWQPEQSSNGAKAAILAARDGGQVNIWRPEKSAWANSAAVQAAKADSTSPQIDYGYTDLGRKGSMLAATSAVRQNRQRAGSTPVVKQERYPDEFNATSNALSAANSANKPGRRTQQAAGNDSQRIRNAAVTNLGREMYTSHPPVDVPDVPEKTHEDSLHASAVAMAQQMYKMQQKQISAATGTDGYHAARSAHGRRSSSTSSDEVVPMRFDSLQEAAEKLAHERLAKLHDEHAQNREYRNYYSGNAQSTSRYSLRGRQRNRSTSDLADDREQSQKIRSEMSMFTSNLAQVDAKKRNHDRESLLAAAQRNVAAKLASMDEKVFADTGKIGPSLLSEWEIKAYKAAQEKSDARMENYGRVNIGGGKFVNQSAVDLAAQRNVQPLLDEINEGADAHHLKLAEIKANQDEEKRVVELKKTREKDLKEANRRLKGTSLFASISISVS